MAANKLLLVTGDFILLESGDKILLEAVGNEFSIDAGSYSVTGTAATLVHAALVSLNAGSYAVTGSNIAANIGARSLAGSYTISGSDIGFNSVKSLAPGSYGVTGADVTFALSVVLPINPKLLVILPDESRFI